MAMSINSLLNMGSGALTASQAGISVTGNNISNVNTPGYSRQSVLLKANTSLDYNCGQVGQGVSAEQIVRAYDKFIESALVSQLGEGAKYDSAYYALRNIEDLFNESTMDGIGATLTAVFDAWNDLAQTPDNMAARQALLSTSQTLTSFFQSTASALGDMQKELESLIRDEVDTANKLISEIAKLNREINMHTEVGTNNANSLMDQRDAKVRELAEILDISIQDNGAGDYFVTSGSGHLLVQGDIAYSLVMQGPTVQNNLTGKSPYTGTMGFDGSDSVEYTIQVVTGGTIGVDAQYAVSMDGGKTWLKEDGTTTGDISQAKHYDAALENDPDKAGNLTLWFTEAGDLATGDKFVISPKNDIYWNSPTAGLVNISSQFYANGAQNTQRITGGALGGYLMARDQMIGSYKDQLDALAQSLIWQVNRIHSQGSGLTPMTSALGEYQVTDQTAALGTDASGLPWSTYLTEGNMTFSIYNTTTGESLIGYPGMEVLFTNGNFDPSRDSLESVRDAFNDAYFEDENGNAVFPFSAEIVDGRLQLTAADGYGFAVASDTTGLMAGLGINTYFTGTGASSIAVRGELLHNPNLVNAGKVNGAGEVNSGDNSIANAIADLVTKTVTISTKGKADVNQSLLDYYSTIVTNVGSDTANVYNAATREVALAQTLSDRREEVVGVSLDEELTYLIKYQSSYKAAAKLITTADEMLQTILGLKQ